MTRSQFDDAGWPDKWGRVQRGYQRVELIRLDPPAKGAADEPQALDDVLRFFTNCNHLADWLKKDRVDPHPEAMNFALKDPDLLICRDLSNGDKHCVLEARFHPTYPGATTTAVGPRLRRARSVVDRGDARRPPRRLRRGRAVHGCVERVYRPTAQAPRICEVIAGLRFP